MEAPQITDVFFDLDHTLWDFEKNSALAFKAIFERNRVQADLEAFLSHYVPLNLRYWELFRNDEISQADLRYRRLKDAFDAIGFYASDELIDLLADDYIEHLPKFNHLFDGTIEVLDYLNSKYRLHIITNGFEQIQFRKLENSKINHYFATITNSELAGVKKPNRRIFEYALSAATVRAENSVMIGDCIDADVRGAINCGLDAILFGGQPCGIPGIKQVTSLLELKKIL